MKGSLFKEVGLTLLSMARYLKGGGVCPCERTFPHGLSRIVFLKIPVFYKNKILGIFGEAILRGEAAHHPGLAYFSK